MRRILPLSLLLQASVAGAQPVLVADTATRSTEMPLQPATDLVRHDGALYFVGQRTHLNQESATLELWRTDGTRGGTTKVRTLGPLFAWPWGRLTLAASEERLAVTARPERRGGLISERPEQPIPMWSIDTSGTLHVTQLPENDRRVRIDEMAVVGRWAVLKWSSPTTGEEPYVVDLTTGNADLLGDLNPGAGSSMPTGFLTIGNALFFTAFDGFGTWLVATDGNITTPVSPIPRRGALVRLGEQNGQTLFGGPGLFTTDGTPSGTTELLPLTVTGGTQIGDAILFSGDTGAGARLHVKRASSTAAVVLSDVAPLADPGIVSSGGLGFFLVEAGGDTLLYTSDGTVAGTQPVGSVSGASAMSPVTGGVVLVAQSGLYFSDGVTVSNVGHETPERLASLDGVALGFAGQRLVRTDGAGTSTVTDFVTQQTIGGYGGGVPVGDRLVFNGNDYYIRAGVPLMTTRGTASTTEVVFQDDDLSVWSLTPFQHGGLFTTFTGTGPWSIHFTDGTSAGTTRLAQMTEGGFGTVVHATTNHAYVSGSSRNTWVTNGTQGGTRLLFEDAASAGAVLNGTTYLLVQGDQGTWSLRRPDGTPGGTGLVVEFPRTHSHLNGLSVAAGRLYVVLAGGTNGRAIYESDGTPGGTGVVPDAHSAHPVAELNGQPFFLGNVNGTEGLFRLTDTGVPMLVSAGPYQGPLTRLGDRLLLLSNSATTGRELAVTDGVTTQVFDILPGPEGIDPSGFFVMGSRAIFFADDGVHGQEIWVTDGTEAGTRLLFDVAPGAEPIASARFSGGFVRAGDRVYFKGWSVDTGFEPWSFSALLVTCGDAQLDPGEACDGGPCCTSECTPVPAGSDCGDQSFCVPAACDGAGACIADPLQVDDGVACTMDVCDEAQDAVVHLPDDAACDDGDECTAGSCQPEGCRFDPIPGCEIESQDPDEGCGCSTTNDGGSSLSLLLLLLPLLRRERSKDRGRLDWT